MRNIFWILPCIFCAQICKHMNLAILQIYFPYAKLTMVVMKTEQLKLTLLKPLAGPNHTFYYTDLIVEWKGRFTFSQLESESTQIHAIHNKSPDPSVFIAANISQLLRN